MLAICCMFALPAPTDSFATEHPIYRVVQAATLVCKLSKAIYVALPGM